MIPKIIHYCWLSNDPYPEDIRNYIAHWAEVLPDYEIKLWNTKSFDISAIPWVKEAFENKKYAFASDYIRFYALYNEGGIYLDSDIEVIKPFDDLLDRDFFLGYEYSGLPEAAVIGAKKGLPWVQKCMEYYHDKHFINNDGTYNMKVAPLIVKLGIEETHNIKLINDGNVKPVENGLIFPEDIFSCKNGYSGKIGTCDASYSIHHFNASWVSSNYLNDILKRKSHLFLTLLLGKRNRNRLLYYIRKAKRV